MRLTPEQVAVIRRAAVDVFGVDAQVRLFGSRTDDRRKGGDIDLHVQTARSLAPLDLVQRRSRFVAKIQRALGEQRIDVIVSARDVADPRPVVAEALSTGMPLS